MINEIKFRLWYTIPYFNGYHIIFFGNGKFEHQLRSHKLHKKYPMGYILPYAHPDKKDPRKTNFYYEMTDICGKRRRLNSNKIKEIILDQKSFVMNYDGTEGHIALGCRNKIYYSTDKENYRPIFNTLINND